MHPAGYGNRYDSHNSGVAKQTLFWQHEDAVPKRAILDIDSVASLCQSKLTAVCHLDVILLHPRRCKLGAYGITHLILIFSNPSNLTVDTFPVNTKLKINDSIKEAPSQERKNSQPEAQLFDDHFLCTNVVVPQSEYTVVETDRFIDIRFSRSNHLECPPSSVDVTFVSSTGVPFIDFHLQEQRTLTWMGNLSDVQTFRVYVQPNHEHQPNDVVYLTLTNPVKMALPLVAVVIEIIIVNSNDTISQQEKNATTSLAYRESVMPWLSGIDDRHVAQRFSKAWSLYLTEPGDVIIKKGQVPRFLAVVAEGTFEINASAFGLGKQRTATKGNIVSFFAAVQHTRSSTELKASTHGQLLVLDAHLFHLHNKTG